MAGRAAATGAGEGELACLVTDIQRFAVHDGPGIRTLVFLKGCPLACAWCANPEAQAAAPEVVWFADRCLACEACVAACVAHALHFEGGPESAPVARPLLHDRSLCVACASCVDACLTGARVLLGRRMTVAELLAEIDKDAVFYEASGGGVTFSGGEPALHAPFVAAALAACRDRGYSTAVETCGHAPWGGLAQLVPAAELFFYDVKHADPDVHRRHTGADNRLILDNLARLLDAGAEVVVRTPIVPGFNDDAESVAAIARLLRSLQDGYPWSGVQSDSAAEPARSGRTSSASRAVSGRRHGRVLRLELLPYHRLALDKYRRLGRAYALEDLRAPSSELMTALAESARATGLEVRVGG